jgi:hypothetical protein
VLLASKRPHGARFDYGRTPRRLVWRLREKLERCFGKFAATQTPGKSPTRRKKKKRGPTIGIEKFFAFVDSLGLVRLSGPPAFVLETHATRDTPSLPLQPPAPRAGGRADHAHAVFRLSERAPRPK